ncbi:MAG TPA: type III-B CRISPR module RAMP protein Cmr1 [Proteobacteria bacterium]|nr:type III-B CRISPR module RAMP protein Cmr1 [Pseudomonadota bacterium]
MTFAQGERIYQFRALSDLWTGSANGKHNRLITTGLLGSIRWWFEVLVRGLGGSACDPTDTKCKDRKHCVVCELFGCTGWARKFRFEVLGKDGTPKTTQITQNDPFQFCFAELRPIRVEEWTLLDATLRLIAGYGAIGGKTVFKPTDESSRAGRPHHKDSHHKDYGLVQMIQSRQFDGTGRGDLKTYLSLSERKKINHGEFAWASLQRFWCVKKKYLARQTGNASTFNHVIGRPEPKQQSGQNDSWIAGRRPDRRNKIEAESKKVFSFKDPESARRTFGFVMSIKSDNPALIDFDAMTKRLQDVWGKDGWEFLTGEKIIDRLFAKEEDRP